MRLHKNYKLCTFYSSVRYARFVQSDIDCNKVIGNKTVCHREALIEQITEKAS